MTTSSVEQSPDAVITKRHRALALAKVSMFVLKTLARYRFGMDPMLKNLSPYADDARRDSLPEIGMKGLLFARGLSGSNVLGAGLAERLATALHKQLAAQPPVDTEQPIPVYHWGQSSAEEFFASYVARPHPVVIKSFDHRARHWTVEWLTDRYGDEPVIFMDRERTKYFPAPLREVWSDSAPYAHNVEQLFIKHPELLDDLDLDKLAPMVGGHGFSNQLFVSCHAGSGTAYHCAERFNLFYMLEGQKRWRFVAPEHSLLLYPYLSSSYEYQTCLVNGLDTQVDEERYPLYRFCPRYSAVLEPGDVLLNPPWWYHSVENLTERTLAVATRWESNQPQEATNNLYASLRYFNPNVLKLQQKAIAAHLAKRSVTAAEFGKLFMRSVDTGYEHGEEDLDFSLHEVVSHDRAIIEVSNGEAERAWFPSRARD